MTSRLAVPAAQMVSIEMNPRLNEPLNFPSQPRLPPITRSLQNVFGEVAFGALRGTQRRFNCQSRQGGRKAVQNTAFADYVCLYRYLGLPACLHLFLMHYCKKEKNPGLAAKDHFYELSQQKITQGFVVSSTQSGLLLRPSLGAQARAPTAVIFRA